MAFKKIDDYKKGLKGIDFLRQLVRAADSRYEYLNDNKNPHELCDEYLESINNDDYNWFTGKMHED